MVNYARRTFFGLRNASTLDEAWENLYDPCPFIPKFDENIHKNGLSTPWEKKTFVNPPYSICGKFYRKACQEASRRGIHVVFMCKLQAIGRKYAKEMAEKYKLELRIHVDNKRPVFEGYSGGMAPFNLVFISMKRKVVKKKLETNLLKLFEKGHHKLARSHQRLSRELNRLRKQDSIQTMFVTSCEQKPKKKIKKKKKKKQKIWFKTQEEKDRAKTGPWSPSFDRKGEDYRPFSPSFRGF